MAKAPNYTQENEARLTEVYSAATSDEERAEAIISLSEEMNRSVNSIRSKLSSMGIYRKPEESAAARRPKQTKEVLAGKVAEFIGFDPSNTQGLENCNKAALRRLYEHFSQLNSES